MASKSWRRQRSRRWGICLVLLLASLGAAQEQPATAVLDEALRLWEKEESEAAEKQFQRALALARQQQNVRAEAEARRGLGEILDLKAEYATARSQLEQALTLYQGLGDRAGLGKVYSEMALNARRANGDMKEAHRLYLQALAESEAGGDAQGKANAVFGLAFTASNAAERRKRIQEGLEIARQLGNKRLEGQFLAYSGDVDYFQEGNFAGAMAKLQQAEALLEKAGARSDRAWVLTSMGILHRAHGQPERAIELYRRALQIQEATGDRVGIISAINGMAIAYHQIGERPQAMKHYQRALELARQTGAPGMVRRQLSSLGNAYLGQREYARAAELFEEVLRQGRMWPYVPVYQPLAEAYLGLGRYAPALEMAEKALETEAKLPELRPTSLRVRAAAKQKLGRSEEALADAQLALSAFEQIRARLVPTDFMKRGFSDQHQKLFAFAIELFLEAGRADQAWEIAEQARARAFLDLLATRELQWKPAQREQLGALRQLERDLKAQGVDPNAVRSSDSHPLALRGGNPGAASLWQRWQTSEPELKSLVSASPISAAETTATARRLRSTILSYWVGTDATFLFVVGPEAPVRVLRLGVSADRLQRLVRETRFVGPRTAKRGPLPDGTVPESEAEQHREGADEQTDLGVTVRGQDLLLLSEGQKKAWRELYQLLIRPARHLLPQTPGSRLTIIPHGALFQVSFAALLDERNRYLVERYTMQYAPAAAVFQFTEKKKQRVRGRPPRYLVVADPSGLPPGPDGKPLPRLPGSRQEARAIAHLLPAGTVTVLAGADAREQNVRELVRDKTVVHFATHSVLRDDQPFESFLALGAGGPDAGGDGRLTAQEIYDLDLEADLVVLSACRTGLGKISGDGIAGLTRAFFYAGTPSVVASLWDVADEPTSVLLSHFYRSLKEGGDKARALRSAQLRLLSQLRQGKVLVATPAGKFALPESPIFWAAFVLQGEP